MRTSILLATTLAVAACSTPATETETACTLRYAGDGTHDLSLRGEGACDAALDLELWAAVEIGGAPAWVKPSEAGLDVTGTWKSVDGGVARDVVVKNVGDGETRLLGLMWAGTQPPVKGADRMLQNGYQSWNYTGFLPLPDRPLPQPGADAFAVVAHGGDNEETPGEIAGTSWWWGAVADAKGSGVMAGADGGTVFKTYLGVAPDGNLQIIQGVTGDVVTLAPGAGKKLDGLFVTLGNVGKALDSYGEHVAATHPPAASERPTLGGWGSWNLYYEEIHADEMIAEGEWMADNLLAYGLDDILLDDGYLPRWGEWSASVTFGTTLEALNDELEALNLRPALWMAPFYVRTDAAMISEHPDWFLRDGEGNLRTFNNVGPDYAALDVSNEAVRAHMTDTFQRLWNIGYRTFKIDFLFGGALEADYRTEMTSLESYALWMKTIREAVPQAHIVGCGAPLLPSVGWVDSMRTGPDIAFYVIPGPRYGFYAGQARHSSARAFTSRWWTMDPDVLILRGDGIDDAEAWTAVIATALTGGNYLLGDGRQASALRLAMALDPEVLAMTRDGVAARALDLGLVVDQAPVLSPLVDQPGVTRVPHIWKKNGTEGSWLAVFGWGDGIEYKATLPVGTVELIPPSVEGETVTTKSVSGEQTIAVEAHGVRVFRLAR